MADNTKIEWCDSTANLWIGCTKVSPGCDNCYAERDWDLRKHRVQWGPRGARSYAKSGWALIRKYQRAAAAMGVDPQLGRRRRIFVNSLSDFFDNHRSITWREEAFALFEASPDVILILVTKRPENVAKMVPPHWMQPGGWPAHVWLLVTAEDQARADHRIPILIDLPVPMVGVSAEPLLGLLRFKGAWMARLGWVIVGGESGPTARPMAPNWARYIRDQCADTNVPFLHKQNGEFAPGEIAGEYLNPQRAAKGWDYYNGKWHECWSEVDGHCDDEPDVYRVGKKAAGRLLDGRTHDGFPASPPARRQRSNPPQAATSSTGTVTMGLETHSFPEWPAAMDVQTALAYTGVGERVLHEFGDELLAFITSTAKRRALKRREARNDMRREMIEADFALPQTEGDA